MPTSYLNNHLTKMRARRGKTGGMSDTEPEGEFRGGGSGVSTQGGIIAHYNQLVKGYRLADEIYQTKKELGDSTPKEIEEALAEKELYEKLINDYINLHTDIINEYIEKLEQQQLRGSGRTDRLIAGIKRAHHLNGHSITTEQARTILEGMINHHSTINGVTRSQAKTELINLMPREFNVTDSDTESETDEEN